MMQLRPDMLHFVKTTTDQLRKLRNQLKKNRVRSLQLDENATLRPPCQSLQNFVALKTDSQSHLQSPVYDVEHLSTAVTDVEPIQSTTLSVWS